MKLLAPFILMAAVLIATVYLDDTPRQSDLVFVNRGDVFTLDPQRQSYLQDFRMTYALYEGLLRWNNGDFQPEDAVASMPAVSEDRRVYTFTLKPSARWSNGDPVTAHDFAYSWMRLLLPDTAADYSNLMFCIEGAEDFWSWRSQQLADFSADPWKADDDTILEKTRGMLRRMGRLLEDGSPLADSEWSNQAQLLLEEWKPLVDVQSSGGMRGALASVTQTRQFFDAMTDPAHRAIEAQWMWEEAQRRFEETVGVRALDDHTLVVRLQRPTAYFLDLVCFGVCYPVHRPCVEGWPDDEDRESAQHERGWIGVPAPSTEQCRWIDIDPITGRFQQKHQWARPAYLIGNGPYVLVQWRYKRDMRLERNKAFHEPQRVASDSIVALTIEDTNTRVLAFETGRVDWLSEVGAEYQSDMIEQLLAYKERHQEELDSLLQQGYDEYAALARLPAPGPGERRNIHVLPAFGTDFYSFNCRPKLSDGRPNPFADPRVRRAFVQSIDKRAIVEQATRLNEPVATTLIPPGSIHGYQSPDGLPMDRARAKRELAAAGWEDRNGDGLIEDGNNQPFPVIDLLWTTNTPRYKWISLELKAQWEQVLGVQVALRGTDTKFYKEDLKQGKFMIGRGRWYGDYGDPTTFLDLSRSTDGNNDRGYKSPRFDAMLDAAAAETDPEQRMRLLSECERFLMDEEVPMMVICQLVEVYMFEPGRLQGFTNHPRLTQYLWQLEAE